MGGCRAVATYWLGLAARAEAVRGLGTIQCSDGIGPGDDAVPGVMAVSSHVCIVTCAVAPLDPPAACESAQGK